MKTDAERLQRLFELNNITNKAKFARENKVPGGNVMVDHHLNGRRPISLEAAAAYVRGLKCTIEEISPELARKVRDVSIGTSECSTSALIADDCISIPVLDVKASCGNGYINGDYMPVLRRVEISKDDAYQLGIPVKPGICLFKASGDSMEPGILDGDHLLVDTNVIEYVGQGVYVINHDGELLCKRLSMKGSTITVSSDNTAYPSWAWHEKPEETRIIGKVVIRLRLDWKKM